MALPTGVHRRGAVFHIQIKVPSDLRASWPTPFYVRKSLGTEDRAAATAAAHRLWAEATEAFAQTRAKLKPPQAVKLTPALLEVLHERIRHSALKSDDERRFDPSRMAEVWTLVQAAFPELGALSSDRSERHNQLQDAEYVWTRGLALSAARGSTNAGKMAADIEAGLLGLVIDWADEKEALIALTRTVVQAYADAAKRSDGEPIQTPPSPKVPDLSQGAAPPNPAAPETSALKLRDVVPDWKAAKKPTPDSTARTERALKLLEASGQDVPITSMTRGHGAAVRAYLLHDDRAFKGKTALNYWQALTALLNVAHDVGRIDSNPWQKMAFEVTGSGTRKPYSDEELKQLFHTPLFQSGAYETVQKVAPADAYWCMLLGLWSGARVGELAQLEMADVKRHNGLAVLSIHGNAGTIKTEQSERLIPVAPELIRLGFVEWAEAQREAGAVKLFPSFHRQGAVTPGEIMSEWNREYRRAIGAAPGPLNGFHRFRHTIRTRLAALQIGVETADTLTGHAAQGSSGRKVYTHVDAKVVYEALGRLSFPLELPQVFARAPA